MTASESSEDGTENVEYCEEDEAKLNPSDVLMNNEQLQTVPYIDIVQNSETLFNLTASSPQKMSPARADMKMRNYDGDSPNAEAEDFDASDGVVNLSPFKSRLAYKERAHRLITSIFELENDAIR